MSVWDLLKQLSDAGNQCVYCGREIPSDIRCCPACENEEEKLLADDARAGGIWHIYRYEGIVRSLIRQLKYDDMPRVAYFIAQHMYEFAEQKAISADVITFAPVHESKKRQRGYDQCELIANHLSVLMDIRCLPLLERVRETMPQYDLGRAERFDNVKNAFGCADSDHVAGKRILLLDDICTTGATMGECAACLQGAAEVIPFTFAKEY